jgi:DNA-binding SARP family transcriptional activator
MNRTQFAVRLFGGFQLFAGGNPVDLPLSSQRLVGFLALQEGNLVRGYVAATLWPDTTDEKAAANLRTALWRLHGPDPSLIVSSQRQLRLHPEVWVDVREIRAAARDQRLSGALPDDDLLISIHGELLPGCWDSWLVFERERLREETVHLCEALCAVCLSRADTNRAVLHALAAVEADPLRESANVWVLRSHLAAGNRAEAMRHARRYAAMLIDELGIEPSPIVDELLWMEPRVDSGLRPAVSW